MDKREPDDVHDDTDRRAFLRRMVAAGFVLPAVAAVESVFAADAAAKHRGPHHCHGHGHGHGHGHCTTTTAAPTTTATPTTTVPPATTTTVTPP
jgi:hypothetical protein